MAIKLLRPIKESTADYDHIEAAIIRLFKAEIYSPLMKEFGEKETLKNALTPYSLLRAIQDGHITFYRGRFKGRFSAKISKELKSMGAVWESKTVSFKFPTSKLPQEISHAISISEAKFNKTLEKIDEKLMKIDIKGIASKLSVEKIFDKTLWRVSTEIGSTLKAISVQPKLTDEMRAKIAVEYNENMKKYIVEWGEDEIKTLRSRIAEHAFSGKRYEGMIGEIKHSYGVSQAKAKFLARQETSLYVSKLKETLYTDAGVNKYKWACVVGSPGHEVRHSHKILQDKIFTWDNPPVVNEKGERKNPGEDYGCRCFPIPVVEF